MALPLFLVTVKSAELEDARARACTVFLSRLESNELGLVVRPFGPILRSM
jgi:hypothetical protein